MRRLVAFLEWVPLWILILTALAVGGGIGLVKGHSFSHVAGRIEFAMLVLAVGAAVGWLARHRSKRRRQTR